MNESLCPFDAPFFCDTLIAKCCGGEHKLHSFPYSSTADDDREGGGSPQVFVVLGTHPIDVIQCRIQREASLERYLKGEPAREAALGLLLCLFEFRSPVGEGRRSEAATGQ